MKRLQSLRTVKGEAHHALLYAFVFESKNSLCFHVLMVYFGWEEEFLNEGDAL